MHMYGRSFDDCGNRGQHSKQFFPIPEQLVSQSDALISPKTPRLKTHVWTHAQPVIYKRQKKSKCKWNSLSRFALPQTKSMQFSAFPLPTWHCCLSHKILTHDAFTPRILTEHCIALIQFVVDLTDSSCQFCAFYMNKTLTTRLRTFWSFWVLSCSDRGDEVDSRRLYRPRVFRILNRITQRKF